MSRLTHTVQYSRPSAVRPGIDGTRSLDLATSGGSTSRGRPAHPRFYSGFLTEPAAAAAAVLAVADVASARYDRRDLSRFLDPVVTGNGDRLRWESFSACCGVYARLDLLREGLDGDEIGYGTTNVDVNEPLRDALSHIGREDPLYLRVGSDEVAVTTVDGEVVEKKVPLSDRWLRGFAEAAAITAGFDLRAELPAAEAITFLRTAFRPGRGSSTVWMMPAGRSLRPTTRPGPGAVCLAGGQRLVSLRRVLRHATGLRVYGPSVDRLDTVASSAWEVLLPGMRLTFVLSPEFGRGFSGEGAALDALASDGAGVDGELLAMLLSWEPRLDPRNLAVRSGLTPQQVRAALAWLGASGRIGFDLADSAYFHRELPYEAQRVDKHNPRLRAARELVDAGAVVLDDDGEGATVTSNGKVHRVRCADSSPACTCQWWTTYRGGRGPCKHALAVTITRRSAVQAAKEISQ
ncbi:SWIM zinc finger family protein [Amycolatopsis pigmentata]|uniref:SWIM zinc finger family protein n=1 Tax=Amycolatopsis pigmentata TaxID=450801 RepID=A0ABW5FMH8_9PSEU